MLRLRPALCALALAVPLATAAQPAFVDPVRAVLLDPETAFAVDFDADAASGAVTFALVEAPPGADIDPATGTVASTAPGAPGITRIVVEAADAGGTARTTLFVGTRGVLFPGEALAPLRASIRAAFTGQTLGYGPGRDSLYARVEADDQGVVRGVYTGFAVALDPTQDPSAYLAQNGINAEHTWPQSLGAGDEPQRSDMHILYPSKDNVNAARGNDPYGEVADAQTKTWYRLADARTSTPSSDLDEWSERGPGRFEPREAVKGDLARALFYFATIYEGAADPGFLTAQLATLLDWDRTDPASPEEVRRSGLVEGFQGNVNPFVLDPTLALRAFVGSTAGEAGPGASTLALGVAPNPVAGRATVNLEATRAADVRVEVLDVLGRTVRVLHDGPVPAGASTVGLEASGLAPGPYVVRAAGGGAVEARAVVVAR